MDKLLVGFTVLTVLLYIIFTIFVTVPAIKEKGDFESYLLIVWGIIGSAMVSGFFTSIAHSVIEKD